MLRPDLSFTVTAKRYISESATGIQPRPALQTLPDEQRIEIGLEGKSYKQLIEQQYLYSENVGSESKSSTLPKWNAGMFLSFDPLEFLKFYIKLFVILLHS